MQKRVATWADERWPGHTKFGFLMSRGGGHSRAAWFVRSHPRVVAAFEAIWGTSELLASLDTPIVWRPWWLCPSPSEGDSAWLPKVERLHCDQNPVTKPGFHCVQGMLPVLPVDASVGGLQVVPRTHTPAHQAQLARGYPELHENDGDDWCELRPDDPLIGTGRLLQAQRGDLILWDSRLIHGGLVGAGPASLVTSASRGGDHGRGGHAAAVTGEAPRLARASFTVCMTPRERASAEVQRLRERAHAEGTTLTHWPHTFAAHTLQDTAGGGIPERAHMPLELTPEQRRLL